MKWKASITQRQKETTGDSLAISTPPSITPQPISGRLDENVESVLLYLFQESRPLRRTRDAICSQLNCAIEAAKYCLDKLRKEKMITWQFVPYLGSQIASYSLTANGREYIMTNKLVKI